MGEMPLCSLAFDGAGGGIILSVVAFLLDGLIG
jgi:hypothetical protein